MVAGVRLLQRMTDGRRRRPAANHRRASPFRPANGNIHGCPSSRSHVSATVCRVKVSHGARNSFPDIIRRVTQRASVVATEMSSSCAPASLEEACVFVSTPPSTGCVPLLFPQRFWSRRMKRTTGSRQRPRKRWCCQRWCRTGAPEPRWNRTCSFINNTQAPNRLRFLAVSDELSVRTH